MSDWHAGSGAGRTSVTATTRRRCHADPGLALRVYRQAMRRGEEEKAALRALVHGGEVEDGEVEDGEVAATATSITSHGAQA